MAVFWDVAPSSLIDTDRRLRETYCLRHQGDNQKTAIFKYAGKHEYTCFTIFLIQSVFVLPINLFPKNL
jgi:hypothetical protein